jgi:hypothetical protein
MSFALKKLENVLSGFNLTSSMNIDVCYHKLKEMSPSSISSIIPTNILTQVINFIEQNRSKQNVSNKSDTNFINIVYDKFKDALSQTLNIKQSRISFIKRGLSFFKTKLSTIGTNMKTKLLDLKNRNFKIPKFWGGKTNKRKRIKKRYTQKKIIGGEGVIRLLSSLLYYITTTFGRGNIDKQQEGGNPVLGVAFVLCLPLMGPFCIIWAIYKIFTIFYSMFS